MKSVCGSFKFKIVGDPVLVKARPDKAAEEALQKLGKALVVAVAKE